MRLVKSHLAFLPLTNPVFVPTSNFIAHIANSEQKRDRCPFPRRKTPQGLSFLFPFDTAKGSIIGLLQATCIMPNSLGSLFSSLLIQVIQCSSSQQGIKPQFGSHVTLADTFTHKWPFTSPGPRCGVGGGQRSRGEEGRGPIWVSPNGVSCGYPSNTNYYVVPPLTLMGCYNDLKWFNGPQVRAPNGPLYTPMRIMNGNDSVVKCFCFFRFLSTFF